MIRCIFNMLVASILNIFTPNNKKIILIGGNAGELYVDNARAMHEYLLSLDNYAQVYWVLNKNAKFKQYFIDNNIRYLVKGSIKSYLYFMKSNISLFSHSISADIVPYLCVMPILSYYHRKNYKVFLNHGTVGLKKRIAMNKKYEKQINKLLKSYNLNPCDSDFEKNIKINEWNMPENTMYVSGYPRYDKLYNNKIENTKDILYMPTWRKYETYGIEKFLTSPLLLEYLNENNMKLKVYTHQLSKKILSNSKYADNIIILDKNTNLFEEIINSKILITDYSSICYDFMFQNKKVVFYQFDKDEYLKEFGSYVNLDDFYYKSNTSVEEVIKDLKTDYIANTDDYFKFRDNQNCKRIYDRINKEVYGKS